MCTGTESHGLWMLAAATGEMRWMGGQERPDWAGEDGAWGLPGGAYLAAISWWFFSSSSMRASTSFSSGTLDAEGDSSSGAGGGAGGASCIVLTCIFEASMSL